MQSGSTQNYVFTAAQVGDRGALPLEVNQSGLYRGEHRLPVETLRIFRAFSSTELNVRDHGPCDEAIGRGILSGFMILQLSDGHFFEQFFPATNQALCQLLHRTGPISDPFCRKLPAPHFTTSAADCVICPSKHMIGPSSPGCRLQQLLKSIRYSPTLLAVLVECPRKSVRLLHLMTHELVILRCSFCRNACLLALLLCVELILQLSLPLQFHPTECYSILPSRLHRPPSTDGPSEHLNLRRSPVSGVNHDGFQVLWGWRWRTIRWHHPAWTPWMSGIRRCPVGCVVGAGASSSASAVCVSVHRQSGQTEWVVGQAQVVLL